MPLHPVALDLLERTGPLGVVAAAPPRAPGEPATADGSFPDELAAHLAVLLDAGPLPVGPASAVVDLTGAAPVLVATRAPGRRRPARVLPGTRRAGRGAAGSRARRLGRVRRTPDRALEPAHEP